MISIKLRYFYNVFREMINLLEMNKQLTIEMTKRELTDQYSGQILGWFWTIGHPLFLMLVYVIVFGYVFQLRIGGTQELPMNYTVYLLSGLIPWMGLQLSMTKSATAITSNANLVKQVVFPVEILPVKVVLSSIANQCISLVLLIAYVLVSYRTLPWTYVMLPSLVLLQTLGMIGLAYIFSAIGAYFRDLKDFIQLFSVAGMYLMPIFYLPEWVPKILRPFLYFNPVSYMAWCYQDALYFGRIEHPISWVVFIVMTLGLFFSGYIIFQKTKVMFGNVL